MLRWIDRKSWYSKLVLTGSCGFMYLLTILVICLLSVTFVSRCLEVSFLKASNSAMMRLSTWLFVFLAIVMFVCFCTVKIRNNSWALFIDIYYVKPNSTSFVCIHKSMQVCRITIRTFKTTHLSMKIIRRIIFIPVLNYSSTKLGKPDIF